MSMVASVRITRKANEGRSALAPLTLCTGRPQPYAECLMKLLDIRAPVVCENGAVLYTLKDNLSRYGPGVTEEKILGLRAVRAFIETEILPGYGAAAQMPEAAAPPGTESAAGDPAAKSQTNACAVLQFGKEAQLSIFSQTPEIFAQIQPRIEQFAAQHGGPELLINASHFYLNISLKGVDKGAALRTILSELNCSREMAAGIGDTEGDLPLREAVAWFACPANAQEKIKAIADYVSPYATIRGVLDILGRPELRKI
jgi:hydroxymethylpyrimidine pyrophosphatase-like HAD family hydrolase